ncbi:MAG: hypothetical protein KGO92_12190, partial [Bacteroidota bacterium]|nr:hypothetical protein [Bacteroidota bacterium]
MQKRKWNIIWYLISDDLFSMAALLVLYNQILQQPLTLQVFLYTLAGAACWVLLYAFAGSYYKSLFEKSRLHEFTVTLAYTFLGCLLIPFAIPQLDTTSWFAYFFWQLG